MRWVRLHAPDRAYVENGTHVSIDDPTAGQPPTPGQPPSPAEPGGAAAPPQYGQAPPLQSPEAVPPRTTSGLAIAGLILAFLLPPIGLILSIVGLFKTGKGRSKGRGLAVGGIVISLLAIGTGAVAVAAVVNKVSTVVDPGCTDGKAAILDNAAVTNTSDPAAAKTSIQTTIDGLATAKTKAKHDNVRNAVKDLEADYRELIKAFDSGSAPDQDLLTKISADANTFDSLCSVGAK